MPAGKSAKVLSLAVAAGLAAVLLYYSLRGVEWREVARIIRSAAPGGLLLTLAIGTVTLFLRACRWRVLLNAEGDVSVATAFWATAAGYFGNNFLPARGGELVRTFLISSRCGLASSFVLATALSERVADAVALVIITGIVLLVVPAQPGWLAGAARPFAILGLIGGLIIAVLPFLGSVGESVIEKAPVPHAWRPRLLRILDHGLRGIRAFHDGRRLAAFLAFTILIWSLDATAVVIAAVALGFRMPISVAFLLIAGLGVGTALPSTPGYVGIYQFVAVTVLTPFGFSRTDVAQVLSNIVIGIWGSLGLWRYRQTRLRST